MTTCNTSWHSLVVVYSVASFGEARSSPNDNSLFDYYVTEEGLHHTLHHHPPPPPQFVQPKVQEASQKYKMTTCTVYIATYIRHCSECIPPSNTEHELTLCERPARLPYMTPLVLTFGSLRQGRNKRREKRVHHTLILPWMLSLVHFPFLSSAIPSHSPRNSTH
jgi:hypothetical protein